MLPKMLTGESSAWRSESFNGLPAGAAGTLPSIPGDGPDASIPVFEPIFATRGPADRRSTEVDRLPARESSLIEQLARAASEFRAREAGGQRTEAVLAVIRSLRRTLAWKAEQEKDPDPRGGDLVMLVSADGEPELWHRGTRIPVDSRPLRDAFEEAGMTPAPGQALLVDTELARHAIEESLVGWSLQELRLRQTKSLLLRTLVDLPARPPGESEPNSKAHASPSAPFSGFSSSSANAIA